MMTEQISPCVIKHKREKLLNTGEKTSWLVKNNESDVALMSPSEQPNKHPSFWIIIKKKMTILHYSFSSEIKSTHLKSW